MAHAVPASCVDRPPRQARHESHDTGAEEFTVKLRTGSWTQKPQKYHAKSLQAIRQKYGAVADKAGLDAVLEKSGCLSAMQG